LGDVACDDDDSVRRVFQFRNLPEKDAICVSLLFLFSKKPAPDILARIYLTTHSFSLFVGRQGRFH
jgi:hypothetical protein